MLLNPDGGSCTYARRGTLKSILSMLDRKGFDVQKIYDGIIAEAESGDGLVVSRWMASGSWADKPWGPLYLIAGGDKDKHFTPEQQKACERLAGSYFGIVAWAAFVQAKENWQFYADLKVRGKDLNCMSYFRVKGAP